MFCLQPWLHVIITTKAWAKYLLFVCLQITPSHYHHYTDFPEGIELLKYQVYAADCVPKIIQYMGLCACSLLNSPVMIVKMCILSYCHHQIGSMNHKPLFRVQAWINGMRSMSYYVFTDVLSTTSSKALNIDNQDDDFVVNVDGYHLTAIYNM